MTATTTRAGDEREAFEAWAFDMGYRNFTWQEEYKSYADGNLQHVWFGWNGKVRTSLSISHAKSFDEWAIQEGLISESHGVRFVNSLCDTARKAWRAALATAPEQAGEAVAKYHCRTCENDIAIESDHEQWCNRAAPPPASTNRLTDEQREALSYAERKLEEDYGLYSYARAIRAIIAATEGK